MANKSRLIDANALIAEYDRVHIGEPGKVRKLMEYAPTIDAVEVVRCKDCDFYGRNKRFVMNGFYMKVSDFCSYGERKEDAAGR